MPKRSRAARLKRAAVDLLLLFAIVCLAYQIATALAASADARANRRLVEREARTLYTAFDRYFKDHRAFPGTHAAPRFDPHTLDPLRKRGFYRGKVVNLLLHRRIDAFESPDDQGPNREFWLEMTLAADPSIRFVVARSDDAPLGGGKWLDGAFVVRDGELERL